MCKDGATETEKFQIMKNTGLDGVELNRPGATPLEEIARAKAAKGLEFAGVICTTHWGKPLSNPNPKVREQGFNGLKIAV
jgi:L-ribulose-5-phosphate 3-epimerase